MAQVFRFLPGRFRLLAVAEPDKDSVQGAWMTAVRFSSRSLPYNSQMLLLGFRRWWFLIQVSSCSVCALGCGL